MSTGETVRLLEEFGIETPEGLVKVDPGLLKLSTVNRYLLRRALTKNLDAPASPRTLPGQA